MRTAFVLKEEYNIKTRIINMYIIKYSSKLLAKKSN